MATLNLQTKPDVLSRVPRKHGLPAAYNDTYLRVLIRNPGEFFVFWECSPETLHAGMQAAGREGSGFRPVLRLFMTDSAPAPLEVVDILLQEGEDSRYIPVPQQGRRYRIEFGFATFSGGFISLCASNEIRTPDATIHEAPASSDSVVSPGAESATALLPVRNPSLRSLLQIGAPGLLRENLPVLMGSSMLGIPHSAFGKPATGRRLTAV